jgi:sporulation protein YlmC with PRC-barrel domain
MDGEKLRGMPIVSVGEGAKLGYVDEVLFDVPALRIVALRARGDDQIFAVPYEHLRTIGEDAITVESSQVTQMVSKPGPFDGLTDLGHLKRLKVVDEAGTLLGTIERVAIDPASGRITSLTAHRGGLLGIGGTSTTIEAEAVRGVGNELVTVASPADRPATATGGE